MSLLLLLGCLCLGQAGTESPADGNSAAAGNRPVAPSEARRGPGRVTPPKLKKWIQATYPPQALAKGLEAKVVLHVTIDEEGRVVDVQVAKPVGHGFDEAALAAVRQFSFEPARVDGRPVRVRIALVYPFKLQRHRPVRPPPRPRRRPRKRPRPRPRARLRIRLLEKGTRDPIPDAECVAIGRAGSFRAYSNEEGICLLGPMPLGRYRLLVLQPEHERIEKTERLSTPRTRNRTYYLARSGVLTYETVITTRVAQEDVSRHVVLLPEIQKIPGTQGDALKAVQNMPGVARTALGGGALIVRGSNPADTRVYVHGHPLPLLYHFGGLTSVINSDILSSIQFVPGNFSVRFGRATGGLVNVLTRRAKRRWHGYADVDVWDTSLLLEGPVGKGSFAVTARRSYIDAVLQAVSDVGSGIGFASAPVYYDYQAMLDYPVARGYLKLLALGADDRMKLIFSEPLEVDPTATSAHMAVTSHRLIALWTRRHGSWKSEASLSVGFNRMEGGLGSSIKMVFNGVDFVWRAETTHAFRPNLEITPGLDGSAAVLWADVTLPNLLGGDQGGLVFQNTKRSTGWRSQFQQAVFVEARWKPHPRLLLVPGLRLDYIRMLTFSRVSFDPRLNATWTLHRNLDLKFGIGLFTQPPEIQYLWPLVGGNPDVGYERAIHLSAGAEWRGPLGITVSAVGFFKWMENLVAPSYDLVIRNGEVQAENVANTGLGRVYGLELLVKKPITSACPRVLAIRKCFGWLSYTLMRAERREDPALVVTALPSGVESGWRLFDWDQTHILTLVASVEFARNWEVGLRFRYVTGVPTTPILGGIYDADANTYVPIFGKVNSERIPDFHQLDLRVDKKWVFRTWMLRIYLDVQNVYYRKNPEFVMYNFDYTKKKYVPGLPIVPSIGIKGEF